MIEGEYKYMRINMMRPCVGIDSPEMLYDFQKNHRMEVDENGQNHTFFTTRNTPKRSADLINGGSVYWITKGAIKMRQSILNIETLLDSEGKKYCRIWVSPEIMLVVPQIQRAMQGWRYLPLEKSPLDLHPLSSNNSQDTNIDPQMAQQLSELGLL